MVKNLYSVWIKVDQTLPWIELKRTYTYKEARKAAEDFLNSMQMKIATIPEKTRQVKPRKRRKQDVKTRKSDLREVLSPAFLVDQSHVCLARASKR